MDRIVKIVGHEILNAKGKPTVEAELWTQSGVHVTASVPSGASTGKYEAHEKYDGGTRYRGFGCRQAAQNLSTEIHQALCGMDVCDQQAIDRALIALDGTPNKERLGGNAILAASVACSKAAAAYRGIPVFRSIQTGQQPSIPHLAATVIAGGAFSPSDQALEFEDYLCILDGFDSYADELEALCTIRYTLEKQLVEQFGPILEDGGALAPPLTSTGEAFAAILRAAQTAGYRDHVTLGLDVAASELYDAATDTYRLAGRTLTREQLVAYYVQLCEQYPISYLEDPFDQDDFAGFQQLRAALPQMYIVGDDLFVTNVERLKLGIEKGLANGLLFKINQIGTVSEAIAAGCLARQNGYAITFSARSGETTDDYIADLAVAFGAEKIKLGSPVRAERNVKFNRLLRIEEEMQNG